jgi:thioredoxin reductase (NADPH)
MAEVYDLIIVGCGPAGMTASIYASRHKLNHIVFEGGVVGGQIALATEVENWPGVKSIKGMELAMRMEEHAKSLGMKLVNSAVTDISWDEASKLFVCASDAGKYSAKALIIATGAMHRKLEIAGEDRFLGKGVSYCATCDGPFFKDKTVAVIGGGDSALTEAVYLASIAKQVYIIHRRNEFRAQEANQEKARSNPKIRFIMETVVAEIKGDRFVNSIVLENVNSKQRSELPVDGVFVCIGSIPSSALVKKIGVATDEKGYIKVDMGMRTNVPGVFAAGDITGSAPQAIVAAGQGAVAAMEAYRYIKGFKAETVVLNR